MKNLILLSFTFFAFVSLDVSSATARACSVKMIVKSWRSGDMKFSLTYSDENRQPVTEQCGTYNRFLGGEAVIILCRSGWSGFVPEECLSGYACDNSFVVMKKFEIVDGWLGMRPGKPVTPISKMKCSYIDFRP